MSTHSLARSGVVQLRRWGLLEEVLDSGAPAIRQVSFNAGGESITRTIKAKAELRELLEQSRARSAVYDVITNQVPVTVEVDTP